MHDWTQAVFVRGALCVAPASWLLPSAGRRYPAFNQKQFHFDGRLAHTAAEGARALALPSARRRRPSATCSAVCTSSMRGMSSRRRTDTVGTGMLGRRLDTEAARFVQDITAWHIARRYRFLCGIVALARSGTTSAAQRSGAVSVKISEDRSFSG